MNEDDLRLGLDPKSTDDARFMGRGLPIIGSLCIITATTIGNLFPTNN